jgi:predicted ATPase
MLMLDREVELEHLAKPFANVRAGAGKVVLVSGEAGIGKTTLVNNFIAAKNGSARVLTGRSDPLFTPSPLAPPDLQPYW